MEQSGVRQIKRPFFVDIRSIRFLDKSLKEKLSVYPAVKEYIEKFDSTDKPYEKAYPFFNVNRLTNLGLFRFYIEEYLRNHPLIDSSSVIMVRHAASTGNGLPVQVYAYTSNNEFIRYEHIQSEVFEHLYAILNEFDLKVYQQPTGEDILRLNEKL
jgi:miniconductance mechanosensitive channel